MPSENRFARKQELIIENATALINKRGVKGMTLHEIAQSVNLNTSSVTHYFRLKEHLAAAVFEQTLDRLAGMVREAAGEPGPRGRASRYLDLHFDLHRKVLRGEDRGIAILSDIRALEDTIRVPLEAQYRALFRGIRRLFGEATDERQHAALSARAHVLMEVTFWLPAWIGNYSLGDFDRTKARLFDILSEGIAPVDAVWAPTMLASLDDRADNFPETGRSAFLKVATRLINDLGYRGASVDRIVAELNVTKGAFYHHLDAKDDLILECFRRSYRRVSRAQRLANEVGGDQWQRLSSTIATLLGVQFQGDWPLLRTTALQALPPEVRTDVVGRSNRMALRFAGMISDGSREGSIRSVDPLIASQVVMAMLNAANDLRRWAERRPHDEAIAIYASTLSNGLFDGNVLR